MAKRKSTKPFTDADVAALRGTPGKNLIIKDRGTGACAGFYVRITPAGGKQYGLQYSLNGRRPRESLGPIEKWENVEAAREHARTLRSRLVQQGVAPKVGGDGTMQAVWNHYVQGLRDGSARRKMKGHPAKESTIRAAESAWKTHFKAQIGGMEPKDVTSAVIADLHATMSKGRKAGRVGRGSRRRGGLHIANRAIAYLQSAWHLSAHTGLTKDLPDPFKHLTRNHETVRKAYIKRADAPKFFKAVEAEPQPYRAYWQTMILVGPRGGELRRLLWQDVDGDTLTFRDTKNRETHEVQAPAAVAVLTKMRPKDAKPADPVFGFDRPKKSWARLLKASGLKDLRPHDVRRSVGTWLGAAGLTSNQVGALLNHKSNITSKVYVQLGDDQATKAAAAKTQAALVKSFGGNVVSIERARKKRAGQAGKGRAKAGAA